MRKSWLLIFIGIMSIILSADMNQMRIVGRAEKTNDIVQRQYVTVNNERAACLIFITDLTVDLDFRPNVELVSMTQPASGQFNVYVAPNERVIDVYALGYSPLTVVLRDYGISTLRSGDVYKLQLSGDRIGHIADRELFAVRFSIQPEDVYISRNEGAPIPARGNHAQFRVSEGTHRFTFSKSGYEDKKIELSVSKNINQEIVLEKGATATKLKLPGFAVIESTPAGAELYLNEQLVGNTPYTGQLIAGNYTYSIALPLHVTESGSFTLNEGETLTLPQVKLTPRYGTLSLQSTPTGANVFLNGQNRGKTPINSLRLDSGEYDLEVRLSMYHSHTEKFIMQDGEEKNLDIAMQPAFGELVINSSPESGATVFIDDREVGKTPYRNNKQPSGKFLVRVEKDFWFPVTREVEISDAKTTTENFTLPPNFGMLNVKSDGAEIFLDGKRVGLGSYQERLKPGRYVVTAKKEKHIDAQESLFLQVGDKRDLVLEPEARMGAVSISSQPFESRGAEIFINNEKRKETTPAVIPLLIGNYEVSLQHRDFLGESKSITINEGQTHNLEFTMRTYAGSMQAKANKWKRNTWIGLGASVLVAGGGFYCNMQANDHYDSYKNTVNSDDAVNYRQKTHDFENYRDYCYYAASGLGIYTIYSFIRSAVYKSKTSDRK